MKSTRVGTKRMIPLRTLARFAVLCVFLAPAGSRAGGHCISISRDPAEVLNCMERAFRERDIDAYAWLLAPEFRWYRADSTVLFTRKSAVATMRNLFDPSKTRSLSLEFTDGYRVMRGATRDRWIIENVGWTESVEFIGDHRPGPASHVVRGAKIYVRITAHRRPRLQIYAVRLAHDN